MAAQEALQKLWLEGWDDRLCGREQAKAWALREVWQEEGAKLMERLRDRAVLAPTRLSGVDWQLCIGTVSRG